MADSSQTASRRQRGRAYTSEKRRDQARATRTRVLAAAHELFVERGYIATTMEDIAVRAGVAVQTVYSSVGNKSLVLKQAIDVAVVGDESAVPMLDRPWVRAAIGAEPRQLVRVFAANVRQALERVAALMAVVRSAKALEPELADQWRVNADQRRLGWGYIVGLLGAERGLRPGLTVAEATDIVVAIMSPEVWEILVIDSGWRPEDWEAWVVRTLEAELLA